MLAMQLLPFAGADTVGCRSAADVTGDYDFIRQVRWPDLTLELTP